MAKKKSRTATATRSAIAPWQARGQMAMQRAAPVVRRVGSATAKAAMSEKHTLTALAAAGALGYMEKEDMLSNFTLIEGVDPKVQIALIAWGAGRFTKNNMLQHLATGLGSVALYDYIKNRNA